MNKGVSGLERISYASLMVVIAPFTSASFAWSLMLCADSSSLASAHTANQVNTKKSWRISNKALPLHDSSVGKLMLKWASIYWFLCLYSHPYLHQSEVVIFCCILYWLSSIRKHPMIHDTYSCYYKSNSWHKDLHTTPRNNKKIDESTMVIMQLLMPLGFNGILNYHGNSFQISDLTKNSLTETANKTMNNHIVYIYFSLTM